MDKKVAADAVETFAQKVYKMSGEELATLYNEAGELVHFDLLEQKDADRIAKLKLDVTSKYDEGFKKGIQSIEKKIKDKYEFESDAIGVELIDSIIETKLADVRIPDGDVTKNPEYIRLINQHAKDKKAWDKELQTKLAAKEQELSEANLFKEIESIGLAEFDKLRPILPADPMKAQRQKNDLLLAELKKYKYQKDGESPVVLKQDGTTLLDEHGYPVTFSNHVKSIAEKSFEFKAAEDRNSPGNNNNNPPPGTKVKKPKDEAEYVSMMKDNSLTPKERVEIMKLHTNK
jgi:hypothetical protein